MLLCMFIAGGLIGFGAGYACMEAKFEVQKTEHYKETFEAQDEIKRLRTQVAKWIGTDVITVDPRRDTIKLRSSALGRGFDQTASRNA